MNESPDLLIREMRMADLTFAAGCTAGEGWVSEDLTNLEGFFLHGPRGCLLAEIGGHPVGICVATCYGKSGFVGELIVIPEARGVGVGARLLNHGVKRLQEWGVEAVYLDGVINAIDLYERNGFHKVTRSWRFAGRMPGNLSTNVRRMTSSDMDAVTALDRISFGADRSFFLQRRMNLFPWLCHVMMEGDELTGYIMGRRGAGWVSAGPWVVGEEAENPIALLLAFAQEAGDKSISIGILDVNQRAVELVRNFGFIENADSPWRMALGVRDDLGTSPHCYAVGSAAKG